MAGCRRARPRCCLTSLTLLTLHLIHPPCPYPYQQPPSLPPAPTAPHRFPLTLPAHRFLPLSRRRSFLPRCHRLAPARRHLGLGSYAEWDEDKRLAFLSEELGGRRPLIPPAMPFSPDCKEVMETLK